MVNLVVPGFVADRHNTPTLRLLYLYATRSEELEQEGLSLDKGLLLYGNVGSGKTDLLRSLQKVLWLTRSPLAFAYVNMKQVGEEFGIGGYEALQRYTKRHWLFDELGQWEKETVGNYSNKINVAESIILTRYEQFRHGHLTHFTTNLSREEMESHYDGRVWSRMQEMCNMVRVVGPDRRPVAQPKVKHRPADSIALMPELSEEDKAALVLQVVEQLKAGEQYRFLDTGGICLSFLKSKGLIPQAVPPEMEAEEMHLLITAARYNDLDSASRKELRRFTEAEELPQDNKYTRELSYRCEKRLLRECLQKLASGEIESNLLSAKP
ncbi:hypothetical protein GCM10023188_26000 [Pontibacter saemangeumensis]|uniref:Uncharacterized protein n=1 Tax=Pontibacter saemangeumensis TaxID=1084525 RepID=A0ABP8LUF6_9BACT